MTSELRRSRRAVAAKTSTYSVGDIVEVERNNLVLKGHLVYNLTEAPSSNPRWLVKFDDPNAKDEELYESSFGKLLKSTKGSKAMPPPCLRRVQTHNKTTKHDTDDPAATVSSEGELPERKKVVSFSESSPTASDDSTVSAGQGSAREQRSRRRQAKTEVPKKNSRKRLQHTHSNESNKRVKTNPNEEVVVVKMLTGTLYLYRGSHRRAEFVRRR